jgi:hypothetical protein
LAISVNWVTKVITVPQADLTLISGTKYSLDVDAFRLELKSLESSEEGMPFDDTHQHNTEVVLSGVTYARFFILINGYTVEFEDGQYTVISSGANHNISDFLVENQVALVTQNSAGLTTPVSATDIASAVWSQSLAAFGIGSSGRALLLSAYAHAIWIDTARGTAGTLLGTNGIPGNPVNNLADAVVLANALGLRKYMVRGNLTLVSGHDDWTFVGVGTEPVIALNGQDVQDSYFEAVEVSGDAVNSHFHGHDCTLDGVTNFSGLFNSCRLRNSLSLAPNGTMFAHCVSYVPGGGSTPVLDLQGAGRTFNLRNYSGGIEIRNMNDASNAGSIELKGQVILAASCTNVVPANALALRGTATLTNLGTIAPNVDALLNQPDLSVVVSEAVHARNRYSKRDNMVYSIEGLLTSGRERWFTTKAAADAATYGGVGEGETDTFIITATPDAAPARPRTFDKVRGV